VYKKLGLFVDLKVRYNEAVGCSDDILKERNDFFVLLFYLVRSAIEDIIADATIYSVLRRMNLRRGDEYWRKAAYDAYGAAEVVRMLTVFQPGMSEVFAYVSALIESVYGRKRGLSRETTEKLRSYMARPRLQEAEELLDSIVNDMRSSLSPDIWRYIVKEGFYTKYIMVLEGMNACVELQL